MISQYELMLIYQAYEKENGIRFNCGQIMALETIVQRAFEHEARKRQKEQWDKYINPQMPTG